MAENIINLSGNPLWYKDAIIYELHIKAFYDSNNDGIGDFKGLIGKLDYLKNLGITAIWLLPFYPSPLKDDGYDIADYYNIHPAYGSLSDFRDLLKQAHNLNIKVITELVLNHTSDQHSWFKKARQSPAGSRWRDFYVWSDTQDKYKEARIIFKDFESSNWAWDPVAGAYFWHRFYSYQPDLNFESPHVRKAMFDVIDFWLEMGVDGLRLDAVPYLFEQEATNCENLPQTHSFIKELRLHIDKKFRDRMLLAEANQWPEDAAAYFGNDDECHMAFNFPVMPRMFMAIQMEDSFPLIDILNSPVSLPKGCQWALFLRNHDELTLEMVTDEERDYMYRAYASDSRSKINLGIRRRLDPLLSHNRRKIELMNILLLSLPGTPVIYYGDEIGMGDNFYLGDRNGVRTPMQWSPDRNAGFSKANPQMLYLPIIIDPEYHYEAINVETQEKNLTSFLWWMKRIIAIRKRFKAFSRGEIRFIFSRNNKVLSFARILEEERILVVVNLSRFSQFVELDLSEYRGYVPEEVFSQNRFTAVKDTPYPFTLGPYNHFWFILRKENENAPLSQKPGPAVIYLEKYSDVFSEKTKQALEQEVLPEYIANCRWYGEKGRTMRKIIISDVFHIPQPGILARILFIEISYNEGIPQTYFLPLFVAENEEMALIRKDYPQAVISQLQIEDKNALLCDGLYSQEFRKLLFDMIMHRKKLKAANAQIKGYPSDNAKNILGNRDLPLNSVILKAEQSNSSIVYGKTAIMKIFRRIEKGINPDSQITRFLSEKARFPYVPKFLGAIDCRRDNLEAISIGMFQELIQNQSDGWSFTLENARKFFERVLSMDTEALKTAYANSSADAAGLNKNDESFKELGGDFFLEMIRTLGQRSAQMHLALSSSNDNADFNPEPFSYLYQRSVYQSMNSLSRYVFGLLRSNYKKFSSKNKELIDEAISLEPHIGRNLKRIISKKITAEKIRIHGDFHLGQVLFTGKDFMIIDFEGEPAKSIGERSLKRSPVRDVAGMARSFHYAAYTGLFKHPLVRAEDISTLEPWVRLWYTHISAIFLDSYLLTTQGASFLPKDKEDFNILFDVFILGKALYEIGYEVNNRPDWISIPLKGIKYILTDRD